MRVIIDFKDIPLESTQGGIILEWLAEIIQDKTTSNTTPLRYADGVTAL